MNLAKIRLTFEVGCPHCDGGGEVRVGRDPDTAHDVICPSCDGDGEIAGDTDLDRFGFARRIRTPLGSCEVQMDDCAYTVQWSGDTRPSIGDAIHGALTGRWSPHTIAVEEVRS